MRSESAVATRGDILLLSRYGRLGASSRVRSYQYLDALTAAGIEVTVCALFSDAYILTRNRKRRIPLIEVLRAYTRRIADMMRQRSHPVLWIEYELLPWIPYAIERLLLPTRCEFLVDYDDAIFHRYDNHANALVRALLRDKIDRIMRAATIVVACNDYLADRARSAGARRVEIIPSVIDTRRYRQKQYAVSDGFTVGWIGSPSTTPYLRDLEPALRAIADIAGLRIANVGGDPWTPAGLAVDNIAWSEATEVDQMLRFDVGVMPLPDEPWARGKCGYKLIQYMGCGLPVVASPVGVNMKIVDQGRTGLLASRSDEWAAALRSLAQSPDTRMAMGRAGREKAERDYSLRTTAPCIVSLFTELLDGARGDPAGSHTHGA